MPAAFASLLIATAVAFILFRSLPSTPLTPVPSPASSDLGFYNTGVKSNSLILDRRGDAKLEQEYNTDIVPEVKGYHDILWAGVKKRMDDGTFLLTVQLAGDPNLNKRYETNYVWNIITSEHEYTILFPNFAQDADFAAKGWYFAVYNNTANKYIVPMTQISEMPKDMVEFPLVAWFIGNPSSFYYWVSVHVRVDTKNLDKPPDYLVDYAP